MIYIIKEDPLDKAKYNKKLIEYLCFLLKWAVLMGQ